MKINNLNIDDFASSIYDAHCHLHLDQSQAGQDSRMKLLSTLAGAALMTTNDKDWTWALEAARGFKNVRCYLGIHPWFAHHYTGQSRWLQQLEERLRQSPKLSVGEIGLDRKWRTPDTHSIEYEAQLEVFSAQLKLAALLQRPVSVHCVKAQGALYEILNELSWLPPIIYLHAYGGAAGTVEQLIRSPKFGDRLYFGFAACVNLRSPKTRQAIEAVPAERLLLESDRSSATSLVVEELIQMLSLYADIKKWSSIQEAADQTTKNALRCYPSD